MPKTSAKKSEIIIQQAQRLKHVRDMLRLNREYIEKKYRISAATLKSWENALTKITEKGLKRCINMYRQEGILLTREWILYGTGLSPRISLDIGKYLASELQYPRHENVSEGLKVMDNTGVSYNTNDETAFILREATFFKESYTDSVALAVTNDDMEPVYQIGDYVGGIFRYDKNIISANKRDCIIRLSSGELLLRRLFINNNGQKNLACINPLPSSSNIPILFNTSVECVAPIIWHRKPNPPINSKN